MTETQFVAALKVVEAERSELRGRLELLQMRAAQMASICASLGAPLAVESRGESNPGGPMNPAGKARVVDKRGMDVLGHAVSWSVADGLRRLCQSVDDLHRATGV